MREINIIVCSIIIGWLGLNLIILGGVYGYILYQHNVNGTQYEFDLLKSRMTIDEFMASVTPEEFLQMMKARGVAAKVVSGQCTIVARD